MGLFSTILKNFIPGSNDKVYKCKKCGRQIITIFNPTERGDQKCRSHGKCHWQRIK